MPGGRPTKYKKTYCKRLITWMSKGLSFESFAGELGVARSSIYEWEKNFEEFSDAKEIGSAKSQALWEKMGIAGASGKLPGFQNGAWVFNMKNRFLWSNKQEITLVGDLTPWSSIVAGEDDDDDDDDA